MSEDKETKEAFENNTETENKETKESKSFTDKFNETVDKAAEKAKPYVEKAKPMVEDVKKQVKKTAKPVVKAAKSKAKAVKKAVDDKLYEHEVIVQYQGRSFYAKDMNESAIEDFVANGGKRDQIKQVQLYVKPEENACYYVINNKTTGKVEL
ncbi:MAG: hypothetical protein J6P45_00485 [Lachnospiraceae bacterium]|nr:hypothetical protein [Lachnospiraceae bacterium]MBR1876812.1 hypothetical protein [Lachnospiraceae bacterium]